MLTALHEFLIFGLKEARACIFAGLFFTVLFLSNHIPLFGLPRYDFIFLAAIAIQVWLVWQRFETKDEVLTLCAFHALGLILELFKTHPSIGSWSYPEEAFLKIGPVPLYSGFMYAAVASYICQAWRLFDLKLTHFPRYALSLPLCAAIYLNFFTHHFIGDYRWYLMAGVVVVFFRTTVYFTVTSKTRRMPLVVAFLLIGFFIWVAENISTYLGAWQYPDQVHTWTLVSAGKINAWFLLVIISLIIVADLKLIREQRRARHTQKEQIQAEKNVTAFATGDSDPTL